MEAMDVGEAAEGAGCSMVVVEETVPACELERERAEKERLAQALRRMHDLGAWLWVQGMRQ